MIFVFGSNLSGIHGAGAAAHAYRNEGAKWGRGMGRSGNSYAIPTKNRKIESLSLRTIMRHVDRFITYALSFPDLQFQVTRIGCGLAGYTDSQIAPMFWNAPSNCLFDEKWKGHLHPNAKYWGTF